MNKSELIDAVCVNLDGNRRQAEVAVNAVIDTIVKNVAKGDRVVIAGWGAFERRDRAARTARNPATGATVRVKKTRVPAFKPGTTFKASVAAGRVAKKTAPAKKAAARTATPARKAVARKAVARKAVARKAVARKAVAKKVVATKTAAKKSTR